MSGFAESSATVLYLELKSRNPVGSSVCIGSSLGHGVFRASFWLSAADSDRNGSSQVGRSIVEASALRLLSSARELANKQITSIY